jgi:hypothetical protein
MSRRRSSGSRPVSQQLGLRRGVDGFQTLDEIGPPPIEAELEQVTKLVRRDN